MAQLFDKILGSPSGELGDMVFRRKKGGNIIAKQPVHRASPLSDAEKAAKYGQTKDLLHEATALPGTIKAGYDLWKGWNGAKPAKAIKLSDFS